jgi:hypothetical protein
MDMGGIFNLSQRGKLGLSLTEATETSGPSVVVAMRVSVG